MMITLIHGDDNASSRKKLQEEKERNPEVEIVQLDGTAVKLPDLALICQSSSFFSSQKTVIIENLLTGKVDKQKEAIFQYLVSRDCTAAVILWESKEIGKTIIKKYFACAKEILCQPSKLLFKFLESIGIERKGQLIVSFHNCIEQEEVELIFVMMLRQWRLLIMVKDFAGKEIAEIPAWQRHKLDRQASFFSLSTLISLYRQLIAIDYKIKTGQTPLALVALLDIFFLSL